jgi:major vault protein
MIKLLPFQYIHVLDKNKNITRLETGPKNFFPQDHEEIVTGSSALNMIILRKDTFALITNPVKTKPNGEIEYDEHGEAKIRFSEKEIRTDKHFTEPFPLYPGEKLTNQGALTIIPRDHALQVVANKDFDDKKTGDEYQIAGPKVYVPRVEEDIKGIVAPRVIKNNCALKLKAKYKCKDIFGNEHEAGDEWLVTEQGFYLIRVCEELVEEIQGVILTDKKAIQLEATKTFDDAYGRHRKAGEQWLITRKDTSVHTIGVSEKKVKDVPITILSQEQFCYIQDPLDEKTNTNTRGRKVLKVGPNAFFLQPGESMPEGVQDVYVLDEDEALLVQAAEEIIKTEEVIVNKKTEIKKIVEKKAGELWIIGGPNKFIPPVEVKVIEKRKKIPLDSNEGIYVRDIRTGSVSLIQGKCYMLKESEVLWGMELPVDVENALMSQNFGTVREKHKLVSFKCPFNAAVQVYDYRKKISRVEFGPKLVSLEPDEQFTMSSLSGSTPKVPGKIKTLYILLGPTFSTDIVKVETSDHARLELRLSYNWKFDVEEMAKEKDFTKIFNVRDFIGDLCKDLAAKVRGTVATLPFDKFHKSSCRTIRIALFGLTEDNHIVDQIKFNQNGLILFNVDIQSVEPQDEDTKEKLMGSVKQAIEITTRIQEQNARQAADEIEMKVKAEIEKKKLKNKTNYEEQRQILLQEEANAETMSTVGLAKAEEEAKIKSSEILAESDVSKTKFSTNSKKIKEDWELEIEKSKSDELRLHQKLLKELEISKNKRLSEIETGKFEKIMKSIGQETLVEISKAGPMMKAELLKGLGLKGYMLMDSESPINLYAAAEGLMAPSPSSQ